MILIYLILINLLQQFFRFVPDLANEDVTVVMNGKGSVNGKIIIMSYDLLVRMKYVLRAIRRSPLIAISVFLAFRSVQLSSRLQPTSE